MTDIKNLKNPWRSAMKTASFRGAVFLVDSSGRSSGRRVVVHTYPKRNDPYSEDMGRSPIAFHITGYLIGPNYLDQRDALIAALEEDGPGDLQVPFPYAGQSMQVMAGDYTVTETRERGGYCSIEMAFTEYGSPGFTGATTSPQADTLSQAADTQQVAASYMNGTVGATPSPSDVQAMWDAQLGQVPGPTQTQPM